MIEYRIGDLLQDEADALVNTVNCVGVMGRGIALQFKEAFPENFSAYAAACRRAEVQPGRMFVFETGQLAPPRYIINFPTKRHWRGKSRIEDIEAGLATLSQVIREKQIRSVAIPPLGSGLGGLDWAQVRPRIEAALRPLGDVSVRVYAPRQAPLPDAMTHRRAAPAMSPGRAVLVELTHRYLRGLLDPFITLLEVHKLMYFMQEAGEPLRLRFTPGHYGPYAENLGHVLRAVEGHLLSGYADGGDTPEKPLSLLPGAIGDATAFLAQHDATRARFNRVAALVDGFESPFGLELLSTVHWVMHHEAANTREEAVARTHAWNARKQRQFSPRQIGIAVNVLTQQGWVAPLDAERVQ
ncbi:macro domain-containing protein [Accumulibacter sp.]|uniref:type II toxin-antitoxin system antitoxin DNA ADP-ribosyl glycohydrolase DarG n=1 Tax=Accumulibacter sp. TaxID=2053492 RepID=UPI0025CF0EDC|nr:macro domain-containing protein [Accumulibacter sp.]MCM8612813.1 macro domain-containing protein [Accumulibacter sp.]MCM8636485.1 macro domain-containing protein [Accumulibacter sp.]MCM8640290.1 macro domain-containing protein [Accumulibacter sp.]